MSSTYLIKEKLVTYNNRVYSIEGITIIGVHRLADATYRLRGVNHQVEDTELRQRLYERMVG
jgi:hypothetical protein